MKRLLSILFSVDERMVILYVHMFIHMLTTVYRILLQNESQAVFVTIGYVFHSTDVSATRKVRNGCTVMSEIALQSINRKI